MGGGACAGLGGGDRWRQGVVRKESEEEMGERAGGLGGAGREKRFQRVVGPCVQRIGAEGHVLQPPQGQRGEGERVCVCVVAQMDKYYSSSKSDAARDAEILEQVPPLPDLGPAPKPARDHEILEQARLCPPPHPPSPKPPPFLSLSLSSPPPSPPLPHSHSPRLASRRVCVCVCLGGG